MSQVLQFKATDDESDSLHLMNAIVVQEDRYSGTYSQYAFTAWVNVVPDDTSGGDPTCKSFWKNNNILFGGGGTPDDAVANLLTKLYVDKAQELIRESYGSDLPKDRLERFRLWNLAVRAAQFAVTPA